MNPGSVPLAANETRVDEVHPLPHSWLLALLLVMSTFLVYQPIWNGQPIWDDWQHLGRPQLDSGKGLIRIWTDPAATGRYDPLTVTAFWLLHRLPGNSTSRYHIASIACHAASALLLVTVLRRLRIRGAWFAAAVFALHPVHAESVAWMSELKNTLSGMFFLAAFGTYLRFNESRARSLYVAALGLFLAALQSKAIAVVWPLGMLVVLWWRGGGINWKRDVRPLIPFVALAALVGLVAWGIERQIRSVAGGQVQLSLPQRVVVAGHACWFYAGKLFWPVELSPIYRRWQLDHLAWSDFLWPLSVVLLLIGLWMLRRRTRSPMAAVLFFIASLSPLIGFISFAYFRRSFVADHLQYLASLGLIVFAVGAAMRLRENGPPWARLACNGLGVAVLMTLGVLTWQHSHAFCDLESFARATLALNPESWSAHDDLGRAYADQGRLDEAIAEYQLSLHGNPENGLAHFNLGSALEGRGQTNEAIQQYELAIQFDPNLDLAHYNLGCALAARGNFAAAITHYQETLRLSPEDAPAHNNLGTALALVGKTDEAIQHFQAAVKLRPDFAEAHINLAHALALERRYDEAIQQYDHAVALRPDSAEVCGELARLLVAPASGAARDPVRATQLAQRACLWAPNRPDYLAVLAAAYAETGRAAEARETAQKAYELATATGRTDLAAEIRSRFGL